MFAFLFELRAPLCLDLDPCSLPPKILPNRKLKACFDKDGDGKVSPFEVCHKLGSSGLYTATSAFLLLQLFVWGDVLVAATGSLVSGGILPTVSFSRLVGKVTEGRVPMPAKGNTAQAASSLPPSPLSPMLRWPWLDR